MIHLIKVPVRSLKLFRGARLVVAPILCLFLGIAEYSCAMGDKSNTVKADEQPSNIAPGAEPVSRSLEQIKKDDARYSQPTTVQEVPFRSTVNEEAYRKAKEKAWQERPKSR